VLATQNPVDLDYKGLSNARTWFLGRLQTERGKARVIEGLEGASVAAGSRFDRARTERILAGLGSRVFLMNNVHEDEPVLFHTRWALSYLRGLLTRDQIALLMQARRQEVSRSASETAEANPAREAAEAVAVSRTARPVVPLKIEEYFLPVASGAGAGGRLVYRPAALGVRPSTTRGPARTWISGRQRRCSPRCATTPRLGLPGRRPSRSTRPPRFSTTSPKREWSSPRCPRSRHVPPAIRAGRRCSTPTMYRHRPLRLMRCRDPRALSRPGQPEGEFRAQLRQLRHEKRDLALEKLRKRYAPKVARLQERIRSAEHVEESVERAFGHVAAEIESRLLREGERHVAVHEGFVGAPDAHLVHLLVDDRLEAAPQRVPGGAFEGLGGRGVPPAEDRLCVGKGQLPDALPQDLGGLARGPLGRPIHGDLEHLDLTAEADRAQPARHGLERVGEGDPDPLVAQEAVDRRGARHGLGGAHFQRLHEAGHEIAVARGRQAQDLLDGGQAP
jgi:hypothetical protein